MSADGWSICPKCSSNNEYNILKLKLKESYGKIPVNEYMKLVNELDKLKSKRAHLPEDSVREHYELGITRDGTFFVSYSGECTNQDCGFKHEFNHKEKL